MILIKATFIGKDSLGYETGKDYELLLSDSKITRLNGTGLCIYGSLSAFLKNWNNINIIEPPVESNVPDKDLENLALSLYEEPLNNSGEKRTALVGHNTPYGFKKWFKGFKIGYKAVNQSNVLVEREAVAFAEWCEKNYTCLESKKLNKSAWVSHTENEILLMGSDYHYTNLISSKGKTTQQLYNDFKKSKTMSDKLYRFVKASEELPDEYKEHHCRYLIGGVADVGRFSKTMFNEKQANLFNKIEWLEEITTPISEKEMLNEAIGLLKSIYINDVVHNLKEISDFLDKAELTTPIVSKP